MSLEYTRVGNIEDITSIGPTTSFLQSKAAEVRLKRINWQSYAQAQIIDTEQYEFISRLDNAVDPGARDRVLQQDPKLTARVFVYILTRISNEQTLQYILTLLDDILQEDKVRVELFRNYFDVPSSKSSSFLPLGGAGGDNLWSNFFGFFVRGDAFCMYQASRLIAKFACWSSQFMGEHEVRHYLGWLCDQLKLQYNDYDQTAARNLQMMLRIRMYRGYFAQDGGIHTILEVLSVKHASRQIQYQLIFCLWCMSFDLCHVERMIHSPALIPTVSDVLREADREKITRISLALFRSMLEKLEPNPTDLRQCGITLVQCKVLRQLELLQQKDFSHDPELTDDMTYLHAKLSASIKDVSSLEEYSTELHNGRLEWSPVHKSETFWYENAVKLTDNNYELIKMLVRLVELSPDPLTTSVAVHDIGEFVRHYPRGKQVIEQLGGKHLVMGLLQHDDPNVRYNALVSLQKIMVHNWEYLGKQLDSTQAEQTNRNGGEVRAK